MNTEFLIPTIHDKNICVHKIETAQRDSYCDWHIHSECELYLCIKGKIVFYVYDKKYELNDGDIFFVNEFIPHKTFTHKNITSLLMQFSIDTSSDKMNFLWRYNNFLGCSEAIMKNGSSINKELTKQLLEINEENITHKKAYEHYIKASVEKIIAILYRNNILCEPEELYKNKQLIRFLPVIEYINEHCCERLSLSDVSAILHVDKSHFCRIFKKTMNTSFIKYLNFARICKAEKLLMETNKTISEISEETGFSSPSYFTETFKQNKFCSPIVYRKIKNN